MDKGYVEEITAIEKDYDQLIRFLEESGSAFKPGQLQIRVFPGMGYAAKAEIKTRHAEPGCVVGI
jgi:hypothetical protein